jgi:hypothetical protein
VVFNLVVDRRSSKSLKIALEISLITKKTRSIIHILSGAAAKELFITSLASKMISLNSSNFDLGLLLAI